MAEPPAQLHPHSEHFVSERQHHRASMLGMWLFLATEVMTFGGLFMGIIVYRVEKAEALREASRHLDMWLGGANTAVLLASSAAMALAVIAGREGRPRATAGWLTATAMLGLVFLAIKAIEYWMEYGKGLMPHIGPAFPLEGPGLELFFNLYFASTGLHALHLAIGIAVVAALAARVLAGRIALPGRVVMIECVGLYWHFVDSVWVFLYPVLYLTAR